MVSMLRHAAAAGRPELFRLAVSARTMAELPYPAELIAAGARIALTREDHPAGRRAGRLDAADLEPLLVAGARYFVCGSAGFAEAASTLLLDAGVAAEAIRVERFGPTS